MSRKFKIRDQEAVHFVTFTTIQWLDIFTRAEYRDIFLNSIRYCQKHKGLEVYAYCIMSSHAHMIVARHGPQQLEHVIRDIKKFTSLKIIEAVDNNPQESRRELLMWLFERTGTRDPNNTRYQSRSLSGGSSITNEKLDQRLNYIHNNPVAAGIVKYPEDYLYSSAGNYAKLPENLLDVMLI